MSRSKWCDWSKDVRATRAGVLRRAINRIAFWNEPIIGVSLGNDWIRIPPLDKPKWAAFWDEVVPNLGGTGTAILGELRQSPDPSKEWIDRMNEITLQELRHR